MYLFKKEEEKNNFSDNWSDPDPLFPEVDPDPHKNEVDPIHWNF